MKPEQIRERMELFGFGIGHKEEDLFFREVCDAYEDLYYKLMEKEDKLNSLNDAVKYYKNMEGNITQMLSTLSEISEKTEQAAEKTAQLTMKEAESKADMILAEASQEAAQILEEAKEEAQEIVNNAKTQVVDTEKELSTIKQEFEAYALRFYDFIEAQKVYFEEHKIDVETIRENSENSENSENKQKEPSVDSVKKLITPEASTITIVPVPIDTKVMQGIEVAQTAAQVVTPQITPIAPQIPPIALQMPDSDINQEETRTTVVSPVLTKSENIEVSKEQVVSNEPEAENITLNQIRKIPNITTQKSPSLEEIEANIPEHIRNIPISDHTETLDEIIQSIKKSYEEVENR